MEGKRLRYLYKLTNMKTNKSYIGQTVDARVRLSTHRRTPPKAMRKDITPSTDLKKDLQLTVLGSSTSEKNIAFMEQQAIKQYNTATPNGYNILRGHPRADPRFRHITRTSQHVVC